MVCTAGGADGERGGAHVFERRDPGSENRFHHVVVLHINSANRAAAVVEVVIGRKFLPFRFGLHVGAIHKMFFDVGGGSTRPLFFAGPESEAHGALHREVQSFQDAHHFHGNDGAGRVIGCTGAAGPRIEVRAKHDDARIRIRAGDFGDDVEGIGGGSEFGRDIEFQRDGNVLFDEARHAVIVFVRNKDRRRRQLIVGRGGLGGRASHNGAPVGSRARFNDNKHTFIPQKFFEICREGTSAGSSSAACAASAVTTTSGGNCRGCARGRNDGSVRETQRQD